MTGAETESRHSTPMEIVIDSKRFVELTVVELHDIFELRSRVFVVEQECAYHDVDGRDIEPETVHWSMRVNGVLAAYLRQLHDGSESTAGHIARIGRVATNPAFRNQGLGSRLLDHVIDATERSIVLDAQSHLVNWYEGFGFVRSGPEYIEDGIPHVPMRRS